MTRRRPAAGSAAALRREQFMTVAATLFAERGYHKVSIDDIGAVVGVTGPALYRYFDSKSALLSALFNKLNDDFVAHSEEAAASNLDPVHALRELVRDRSTSCVHERAMMSVFARELRNLPAEDQRALRLGHRTTVFNWMNLLGKVRPDSSEAELRALVHAALSACNSVIYYRSTMPDDGLIEVVSRAAERALGIPPRFGEPIIEGASR